MDFYQRRRKNRVLPEEKGEQGSTRGEGRAGFYQRRRENRVLPEKKGEQGSQEADCRLRPWGWFSLSTGCQERKWLFTEKHRNRKRGGRMRRMMMMMGFWMCLGAGWMVREG